MMRAMRETAAELAALQELLDASAARSGPHLRDIINPQRRLNANQLAVALGGMKVLVLATVTAAGEPRTSCVDGHFLHGRWVFSTSGSAYKARHLAARPAVSATYVDGERIAVFVHGSVERVPVGHPDFAGYDAYLTDHYHSSPTTWGPDIAFFRIEPAYMIGYAMDPAHVG
jgi:pyridoxine/pyridoxamine 5'-phosphate oxidase